MARVMIRYKVKADHAEDNERLVRAVYDELDRAQPAGMRYATFVLEDGVSFVHLHSNETADGSNALTDLPAFKEFQRGLGERCAEPPVLTPLREVGSFRFFERPS